MDSPCRLSDGPVWVGSRDHERVNRTIISISIAYNHSKDHSKEVSKLIRQELVILS